MLVANNFFRVFNRIRHLRLTLQRVVAKPGIVQRQQRTLLQAPYEQ
jgi:hypothetical protein